MEGVDNCKKKHGGGKLDVGGEEDKGKEQEDGRGE